MSEQNNGYYDGTKLLSMKDINGNRPEIYMVSANNTAGKTTYFSRLLTNRFIKDGEKFMLIYRFNYELDECADKFFKDIGSLFFTNYQMNARKRASGSFCELSLNDKSCGYAVSLNNIDNIKKFAHLFSDTKRMYMDEFQSETGHYCPDEITKFRALHKAVARGQGEMVRYVPVYMTANPVTLLNPYYTAMHISERLNSGTKFLRGAGFVLEQAYNDTAGNAQKASAFNQAFGDDMYAKYSSEAVYLEDNYSFIEKPDGFPKYIATLKYQGCEYGIKEYAEQGIIYCDDRADSTFPVRISMTTKDHELNYVMLKKNDIFIDTMRYYFRHGCFRFKNLKCKEAVLRALSY